MGDRLAAAFKRLENVSNSLDFGEEVVDALRYPRETLAASLPLGMDDDSLRHVKAWRCRYSDLLGPTKGGVRFHPSVSHDEVMTLAFWMTVKCALTHLPYGGAKGGVQIDAGALSPPEKERLSREFVKAMKHIVGPDRDIPAPDVATDAQVMAWFVEEYAKITGAHTPDVVTGKPLVLGGLDGRTEATGKGCAIVLEELEEDLGIEPENSRVAIQGFGNGGRHLAKALTDRGYTIVAIADSSATRFAEDGLSINEAIAHKDEEGSVKNAPGAGKTETREADAILSVECDILVPAALGGVLTKDTARDVNASVILELANGPTEPDADDIFSERGIAVIPDVLANAGGVVASYHEWQQNAQRATYAADDVHTRLKDRLTAATSRVRDMKAEHDITWRDAAYAVALKRLCTAIDAKGC